MFGQPPRSDSDFWRLVKEKGIVEEEDLEEPIDDLQNEIIIDEKDDYNDYCDVIDIDVVQLVEKLSDDVAAGVSNESSLTCSSPVNLQQTKHNSIRKVATNNYMNVVNKKLKHYHDSLNNEADNFNLYDCVDVKIHPVDRNNTDAKVLPCLIIEKIEQDEQVKFKWVCEYGKLDNFYSLEHLIDLKMACQVELKNIVVDNLKNKTFIEACKFYVRASTTGQTCDCKSKCRTK